MTRRHRPAPPRFAGGPPVRLRLEPLGSRCVPSAVSDDFCALIPEPVAAPVEDAAPAARPLALLPAGEFSGTLMELPAELADGRLASVDWGDGSPTDAELVAGPDGWALLQAGGKLEPDAAYVVTVTLSGPADRWDVVLDVLTLSDGEPPAAEFAPFEVPASGRNAGVTVRVPSAFPTADPGAGPGKEEIGGTPASPGEEEIGGTGISPPEVPLVDPPPTTTGATPTPEPVAPTAPPTPAPTGGTGPVVESPAPVAVLPPTPARLVPPPTAEAPFVPGPVRPAPPAPSPPRETPLPATPPVAAAPPKPAPEPPTSRVVLGDAPARDGGAAPPAWTPVRLTPADAKPGAVPRPDAARPAEARLTTRGTSAAGWLDLHGVAVADAAPEPPPSRDVAAPEVILAGYAGDAGTGAVFAPAAPVEEAPPPRRAEWPARAVALAVVTGTGVQFTRGWLLAGRGAEAPAAGEPRACADESARPPGRLRPRPPGAEG